eukprot:COSAG06_NODE_28718_length_569_cov_1.261702_1_plen_40_part_10
MRAGSIADLWRLHWHGIDLLALEIRQHVVDVDDNVGVIVF